MSVLKSTLTGVQKAAKAIYAAVVAAISGTILVTLDGVGFSEVSTNSWLVIALSVVVAGGGVSGLSNKTT